ncbi:MAG: hypothetical protein COB41_05960 [Proteobacteria bacterium]|nr:MAG: hypothetical protein COB41_05960 [Pseudomonadota bacterium]
MESAQDCVESSLLNDKSLVNMGLEVVSVRVFDMRPTAELEKALEAPTRESIQQLADEAVFSRRALAVQKERAIAENELQNQIELAKREHVLIEQKGENSKRTAQEEAEAAKITVVAEAEQSNVTAQAKSERIRMVESVKVDVEKQRMAIYKDFSSKTMMGLAARELAGKLEKIEHLNITPDILGAVFSDFLEAGTQKLKEK